MRAAADEARSARLRARTGRYGAASGTVGDATFDCPPDAKGRPQVMALDYDRPTTPGGTAEQKLEERLACMPKPFDSDAYPPPAGTFLVHEGGQFFAMTEAEILADTAPCRSAWAEAHGTCAPKPRPPGYKLRDVVLVATVSALGAVGLTVLVMQASKA